VAAVARRHHGTPGPIYFLRNCDHNGSEASCKLVLSTIPQVLHCCGFACTRKPWDTPLVPRDTVQDTPKRPVENVQRGCKQACRIIRGAIYIHATVGLSFCVLVRSWLNSRYQTIGKGCHCLSWSSVDVLCGQMHTRDGLGLRAAA
jgi:hypothetical protein